MAELDDYAYRGARAMVLLHEEHMRAFLAAWRRAKAAGLVLVPTPDPSYASWEQLLTHVLDSARGYMVLMARLLGLPDPAIDEAPSADQVGGDADAYLEHLLARWWLPLREVPEARFFDQAYDISWPGAYVVEALLLYAVTHPLRHTFQLQEWLGER